MVLEWQLGKKSWYVKTYHVFHVFISLIYNIHNLNIIYNYPEIACSCFAFFFCLSLFFFLLVMTHKWESRLLGEISTTSDMQMIYYFNGRQWRGTKEPLDEGEEENKKVGLKFNVQKTKIMASSPITSWQIVGGKMGTVTDFIFWGSKITANGSCSHEIKRQTLEGKLGQT